MLGGFQCSKNTLIALNIFYIIVGIILICLGTKWINTSEGTSLPIIGGIVACGVFLILISILGIFGAMKHHQVVLFFYMIILFVVFLIQFSVACACLGVSDESQASFARQGWNNLDNSSKLKFQTNMECCGFNSSHSLHPSCLEIPSCIKDLDCSGPSSCCGIPEDSQCMCGSCEQQTLTLIAEAFQVVGGVSLFFSFTEIIGAFLAYRYRNLYAGGLAASTSTSGQEFKF